MKIRKGLFITGLLVLLSGLIVGLASSSPASWILYLIAATALVAGIATLRFGRRLQKTEVASRYMWIEGLVLIVYSVALLAFGAGYGQFVMVTMLFLLVFGLVEFTLMLQVLSTGDTPNWKVFAQKLIVSVASVLSAVHINNAAGNNDNLAVLLVGLIAILIGASFINERNHVPTQA